jgi:copper resistance protein B
MDHGAMNHAGMNHGGMDMGGMDMGSSSTAPADARDPHGYSNGYTLNTGPYAQKDTSALMMSDMHSFGSFLVDRLERVHTRMGILSPTIPKAGSAIRMTSSTSKPKAISNKAA